TSREAAWRMRNMTEADLGGTFQARFERNAFDEALVKRLADLDLGRAALVFGRIDRHLDGTDHAAADATASGELEAFHIGRLAVADEHSEPVVIDWRAPVAEPFYRATGRDPMGLVRRRHFAVEGRSLLGIEDELFGSGHLGVGHDEGLAVDDPDKPQLRGYSTLIASIERGRTGTLGDIVATIQAEQDRIIRSKPSGVLVVQGGPGTGKTAVALHRAAYLLYTHRERLARRGVLVVGPNPTFLRYIGQVLPSLGETAVVLGTVGQLHPGLDARRTEPVETAEVKGRAEMAAVVAAAVRDRQQVPRRPVELVVEQQPVRLDRDVANQARSRARRSRKPHNEAKRIFHTEAVRLLAEQVARTLGGRGLLDAGDLADIRRELAEDPHLTRELDALWPTLSAEQLLTDLFADPGRLGSVARRLPAEDRARLARPAPAADVPYDLRWTAADVPLLDEAAELLGDDGSEAAAREAEALREEVRYAQGVLDVLDLEEDLDPELLRATDIVDADRLAERQRVRRYDSTAERAAADREWTYGHVIVDEAQELSPMAWRLIMRRCPSRSMTIVGDIAQTGDLAGAGSWQDVLGPFVASRWRLEQLTVNYRTPSEIADVADDVLALIDAGVTPPRSVRSTGVPPRAVAVGRGGPTDLADTVAKVVAEEAGAVEEGRTAVLAPVGRVAALARRILGAVPTRDEPDLESPVVVLPISAAKGLEFDAVVLVEPAEVLAASPRGVSDLYVALTRATQRLAVVHAAPLPPVLHRLAAHPSTG
ncbi:MAG TPA: ATP-binding domain-containing protein, partial [Pseudonocardia sp.]|nr:ATP-binding domain-containing protein [Pseudonocardia sp.]